MDSSTESIFSHSQWSGPAASDNDQTISGENTGGIEMPSYWQIDTTHVKHSSNESKLAYAIPTVGSWHKDIVLDDASFNLAGGDQSQGLYMRLDVAATDAFSAAERHTRPHSTASPKLQTSSTQQYKPTNIIDCTKGWYTETAHESCSTGLSGVEVANRLTSQPLPELGNTGLPQSALYTDPYTLTGIPLAANAPSSDWMLSANVCIALPRSGLSELQDKSTITQNKHLASLLTQNLTDTDCIAQDDKDIQATHIKQVSLLRVSDGLGNAGSACRCPHPACSSRVLFTRQCDLDKHYRIHSRKYICRFPWHRNCHIIFATVKDRNRHERGHVPSIPCQYCGRLFSRQDNLRDHCRKLHTQDNIPIEHRI